MSESHASHSTEHAEHPPVPYYLIFGTLLAFTVITIYASFIHFQSKALNVTVAFAIAAFKASLVMLFFMHLKYEKKPIVLIALAPFALVVVLITALFPDIANGQFHSDQPLGPATAEHHEAEHK
jgi:cytochrome c oxidase subunit 4